MKNFVFPVFVLLGLLALSEAGQAQVSVSADGQDVQIGNDGSVRIKEGRTFVPKAQKQGNEARVTVGGIAEDAHIEGITIINDRVSIDGKEIPSNVTRYKSPETGKVYLIRRKGSSVSVSEAGGEK